MLPETFINAAFITCTFSHRLCSVFVIAISMLHVRLTYVIKVLLTYLPYLTSHRLQADCSCIQGCSGKF